MRQKKENIEVVKILLSAVADPNKIAKEGKTALMFAKDANVAQMLLDAGANPNQKSKEPVFIGYGLKKRRVERTALDYAMNRREDAAKRQRKDPQKDREYRQKAGKSSKCCGWRA